MLGFWAPDANLSLSLYLSLSVFLPLPLYLYLRMRTFTQWRHNAGVLGSRQQFVFVSVIVGAFVFAVVFVFEDEKYYPMETQCWGSGFHAPLTHSRVKEADNVERKTCPGLRDICM